MTDKKQLSVWDELRKPFPKEAVGLLPKVNCYHCTQATKVAKSALDKHCGNHKMSKCSQCNNFITEGHIHLDYVGHASVTDRLNIAAGPENWTWEPVAYDEGGLPRLDRSGNLWIKLTVKGVTRLGYGDGSGSMKELIGDALRNAAMRFGVALDLWSKEELESNLAAPENKNEKPSARPAVGSAPVKTPNPNAVSRPQVIKLQALFQELGLGGTTNRDDRLAYAMDATGNKLESLNDLTKLSANQLIERLQADVESLSDQDIEQEMDRALAAL